MKVKFFNSIKVRVTGLVLLVVMVGCLFMAYSLFDKSRDAINELVEKDFEHVTNAISIEIEKENEMQFLMLQKLADLPNISDPNVPLLEKCDFLSQVSSKDDRYGMIAFYDADGNAGTEIGTIISGAGIPFFEASIKGKNYIQDPSINPVTETFTMCYSVPVKSPNGNIIGVLMAVLDGTSLCDVTARAAAMSNARPMIINRQGVVVGEPSRELALNSVNLLQMAQGSYRNVIQNVCDGGTGYTIMDVARSDKLSEKNCIRLYSYSRV